MPWKPAPRPGADLKALRLSPMQGYLVARLDGAAGVDALARQTGLTPERVHSLLGELVALGAVEPPGAAGQASPGAPHEAQLTPEQDAPPPAPGATDQGGADDGADDEPEPGTHRQLYASEFGSLTVDERVLRAHNAVDPRLSALCFDPVPRVVQAMLENPGFGLTHARLIERHPSAPSS